MFWVSYWAVEGGSVLEVFFCVCLFRTMVCDNKSAARYVDLGSHSGSGDRDHLRLATLHKVPGCHGGYRRTNCQLIPMFRQILNWKRRTTLKNKQASPQDRFLVNVGSVLVTDWVDCNSFVSSLFCNWNENSAGADKYLDPWIRHERDAWLLFYFSFCGDKGHGSLGAREARFALEPVTISPSPHYRPDWWGDTPDDTWYKSNATFIKVKLRSYRSGGYNRCVA